MKDIVVLYHGSCIDGFSSAYVAWKKFGENADYVAVHYGEEVPQGLEGKEVYIVDFSYPEEVMLDLESKTKRLVVLDHHVGARVAVEKVREHVFDNDHSGVGIAWNYFFPEQALSRMFTYVEDNDLWRRQLPHARVVAAYLGTVPFDFMTFDRLVERFENEEMFLEIVAKGTAYLDHFNFLCQKFVDEAQEVELDGHIVLATSAPRIFRSEVGHALSKKKGPFGIVYYPHHGSWHFSLRGDGSIDLSALAQQHGGNGHYSAASFRSSLTDPLPFRFVGGEGGEEEVE